MQQPREIDVDTAIAIDAEDFDPTRYLINLNGKGDYLEVKFRILWFRKTHPDGQIVTEFVNMLDCGDRGPAIFRATVTAGTMVATGWGTETATDFRDFIEKAETKAIGRALAAAGFGTQFCEDHNFGANATQNVGTMRIVDTPVDLASSRGRRSAPVSNDDPRMRDNAPARGRASVSPNRTTAQPLSADSDPARQRATDRQIKFIGAIAREAGLDEQELATWCAELYNTDLDKLNRRDASALIEALQRRRDEIS